MPLTALGLNCTLKPSPKPSSTELLMREAMTALAEHGVEGAEFLRMADLDVRPGVSTDAGPGDAWPPVRQRILDADILLLGTPIWLGQPSSVVKRVLERLDALYSEKDERRRMPTFGKVAVIAIVGNEDGAHHVTAELTQALTELGFTVPAQGAVYWVGEALGGTDYADLAKTPEAVASMTAVLAANAAHLARLLRQHPYPGVLS